MAEKLPLAEIVKSFEPFNCNKRLFVRPETVPLTKNLPCKLISMFKISEV